MASNTLHVLLDIDCSIRVYQSFVAILKIFPIMLALCLMLSVTYYAQNYAGIIGWSLTGTPSVIVTSYGHTQQFSL